MKNLGRRNRVFRKSLKEICEYLYNEQGQPKDHLLYFTIFPRPEMNDYALSCRVKGT